MTAFTTLPTSSGSGGTFRPANSRCPAPTRARASASTSASAAMRPSSRSVVQVGGDHGRGLGQDRDAGSRPGLAQPGAQLVPEGDETDDRHGDRVEQVGQRPGQVAGDGAGAGGVAQGGGLAVEPGDAVQHELGEEGVEVGEVPVQDALGAARLRR